MSGSSVEYSFEIGSSSPELSLKIPYPHAPAVKATINLQCRVSPQNLHFFTDSFSEGKFS